MWLAPGWKDPTSPAVWTNDNIDFAIDSALSPTYALVDPQFPGWIYKTQLAYGVSQRDARRQGRSDAFTRELVLVWTRTDQLFADKHSP